ncbi:zinc-binding protein [Vibrio cidicii]|uniref:zinc uptake protein ZrgA n=1 Tax=Vibrio cidicii TaxID=1763883 RepID=UPI0018C313B1|nr:DUF2796 domain-containing protein [Vibrio cidicii]MBG0760219.1 zinc-binding protein [Vibrio cidicii]
MLRKTSLAVLVGLSFSSLATVEEGFRQHDAHVHGQVEFNVAQDGHDLLIEITAPGADVVGFEHAPENAEQEQRLQKSIALLQQADQIVTLNAKAKCQIEKVDVAHTLAGDEHHHDHHDADEHEHEHEHEHHEGDKHDHEKHHDDHDHDHDHDHDSHGAFTVQYQYHCDNLAELSTLDTQWFSHFAATQSITANVLTDKKQSATQLSAENARISLK